MSIAPRYREILIDRPVARLASSDRNAPHVVPIVFVLVDDTIVSPLDGKPKSGKKLRRVSIIEQNPAVSLIIDEYSEDWEELWWLRIDGVANIESLSENARKALLCKYPQYQTTEVGKECISIEPQTFRSWNLPGD